MPSVNYSNDAFIMYRDALKKMSIDMQVDEPLMKEWVLRNASDQQVDLTSLNRSTLSMTKSMASRTNNFISRHQDSMESVLLKTLNRQVAKYNNSHSLSAKKIKLRNGSTTQNKKSPQELAYGGTEEFL